MNLRLRLLFTAVLTLAFVRVVSQTQDLSKNFVPATRKAPETEEKLLDERYVRLKAGTTGLEKKQQKEFDNMLKERREMLTDMMKDGDLMFNSSFEPYIQSILNALVKANPELKGEIKLYVSSDPAMNAYSVGEGTIMVNIGLVARLHNEAQLAFILGHELAHYNMDHHQRFRKVADGIYNKELESQLKKVQRYRYGQRAKMMNLLRTAASQAMRHRRDHEFEADTVGLRYLSHTKYATSEAISAMDLLEKADKPLDPRLVNLTRLFTFDGMEFKTGWLRYEADSTWHDDRDTPDSLRTHPDCDARMAKLSELPQMGASEGELYLQTQNQFDYLQKAALFEIIESLFHYKVYGRALFRTLQLLEDYPDNAWLHARAAQCLYQLAEHQKAHNLEDVLILPDSRLPENYNRFLTFFNNLRLSEISSLAYHYANNHKDRFADDEAFLYARVQCSLLGSDKNETAGLIKQYLQKFPKGVYTDELRNNGKPAQADKTKKGNK